MAVTKEQLQQLQGLAGQYGGANSQQFKDYVNTKLGAGGYDKIVSGLQQVKQTGIDNTQQNQPSLTDAIKSGNFTAEQAYKYNQMTGNNQGARDLALTSQQAVNNLQTTITPEETVKMANAGINSVGEGVKPDLGTQSAQQFANTSNELLQADKIYKQFGLGDNTQTTKVTTENTPNGTIKTTETPTGTPKIETIEQFKQAGGGLSNLEQLVENRYGTVATQNPDGSLTAEINGEKFKWTLDASGNPIKQSLGKVGVEEMKQIQLDPNNLFNQIRSGQVPTKDIQNTDEYKKSKQRADNLGRFENMSAKDLSYSINNGDLLPGTQTYNDLKTTRPDLIAEAEKLNALNSALTTTEKSNTDIQTKITEQIFKIFNGDKTTLKTKLSENQEVVKLNTDMATKKNELNSLKDSINNAYRDIEKEKSGTGVSKGYIQALASKRTEDLTRDYNTKLNEYNTMAGQLQTITEMVGDELQQEEKQQAKQLQALQFAYGIAKDETDYQRSLQAEQRQREYQQNLDIQNFEQQKEMLALQQDYQDRNIQTDMIQVGNKNVLINRKTGETIKSFDLPTEKVTQTQYGFSNVGDGTIAVTDQKTGKVTFQNSKGQTIKATPTDLISTPDGTILDSRLSSTTNPNGGKECGEFVNDITGIGLGDTLQSKLNKMETKATNSYEAIPANIGDVAVWVPDPTNKAFSKYGHAGIIIGEEGNNWIIKSSNIKGDGVVSTDKVPKQTIMGVSGKYDKSKLQGGTTPGGDIQILGQFLKDNQSRGPGYSEEDVKAFDSKIDRFIQNNDEKGMALAFRKNIFEDKDFKQEFDNTKKFQTGLTQVEKLISDYEKAGKSTNALKSMAEKVARSTGLTTDEALAQMQTQMGFVLANYIKSISGTAASDAEVQRLMGNMANISNVSSLNKTILSQVKSNSQASLESMIDTRMYGLPESFKYKAFDDIYGNKKQIQTGTPTQTNTQKQSIKDLQKKYFGN